MNFDYVKSRLENLKEDIAEIESNNNKQIKEKRDLVFNELLEQIPLYDDSDQFFDGGHLNSSVYLDFNNEPKIKISKHDGFNLKEIKKLKVYLEKVIKFLEV